MNIISFSYSKNFELSGYSRAKDHAMKNISSGSRANLKEVDSGSYSMLSKLKAREKSDSITSRNLQNLLSFSQSQESSIKTDDEIVSRMSELASYILVSIISDTERLNYNKEFLKLSVQLDDPAKDMLLDTNLFGSGTGGLDYVNNANGLDYTNKVGLINDPDTDSIRSSDAGGVGGNLSDADVIPDGGSGFSSNITNTGSYPTANASINSLYNKLTNSPGWLKASEDLVQQEYGWSVDTSDGYEIEIDSTASQGGTVAYVSYSYGASGSGNVNKLVLELNDFDPPHIEGDRIIAHEMVHALQAQNTYIGDPTGDGSSSANWLKEGLAEFIHGGDSRDRAHLGLNPTDDEMKSLINQIGTGNESWSWSDQYAAAYLAVRFLHSEIKEAGHTEGIKHLAQWMKTQHSVNAGSASSCLNTYMEKILSSRSYSSNDSFLDTFKGTSSLTANADSTGKKLSLNGVSPVQLGGTSTYNLNTVNSSSSTLTQLNNMLQSISTQSSNVAANSSILSNQLNNLNIGSIKFQSAISKIEDTDISSESIKLANPSIRTNFSLLSMTQAKQISQNILNLILL